MEGLRTGSSSPRSAVEVGLDAGAEAPIPAEREARPGRKRRREAIPRRDAIFRRSLAIADMAAVGVALTFSAMVAGDDRLTLATLAVPPLFVLVVKAMGLYDRDEHLLNKTTLDEVPALFGIATLGTLLLWLSGDLLIDGELGRRQILGTWALLFVLMIGGRALARYCAGRLTPVERCLLVGDPKVAEELRGKLAVGQLVNAELVGVVPPNGHPNGASPGSELLPELGPTLLSKEVDRVIIAADPDGVDELLYTIRELKAYGVKVSVLPDTSRVAGSSVELDHLHGITLLGMRRFEITRSSRSIKRGFDLVVSATALAVLAPILIAVAVALKLDSPGPVLFRQRRIGRNGDEFEMLKFRSMVDGADHLKEELRLFNEGAAGLFKISGDPRITRIGRILRRWSLDELPQLFNVLRGEMALVGPRPLVPEEDQQVEGWYRRRLDVAPGMTGHWQVLGASRIPLDEMVKLDYLYVANWSVWNDIRLLLRTMPVVFGRRGM